MAAAIRTALAFAEPLQLRRLAISLIGVEHGVFTPSEAAEVLIEEMTGDGLERQLPEAVVIATANAAETVAVTAALATRRAHVT